MNRFADDADLGQAHPTDDEAAVVSDAPAPVYRFGPEPEVQEIDERRAHWARDAVYWTQRLRLGAYFQLMPGLLNSVEDRTLLVHKWLNTGLRTWTACELLDLSTRGTVAQRQERLAECPDTAFLLLACAFAVGKKDKAVEQTAELKLTPETRNQFGENERIDDRHVAAMVLFDTDPTALQTLRALDEWHSLTAASADLNEMVALPSEPLEAFLMSDRFHELLVREKARFDSLIPMGPGHWLLALTRNLRAQHIVDSDEQILHGWREETVVLHFRDGGRRVRISARSGLPSRILASRIASAYFDRQVHYTPDLAASSIEAIYGLIDAALNDGDDELELVGLTLKGALPGKSGVALFGFEPVKETYDALCAHFGDLMKRLQCVKQLQIRFEHRTAS